MSHHHTSRLLLLTLLLLPFSLAALPSHNCVSPEQTTEHLVSAARDGNQEAVVGLLFQGVDPNIPDMHGNDAFSEAVLFENINVVRILLAQGASNSRQKNLAFLYALNTGNAELVHLFLYYGADANIKNELDTTALINAVRQGCTGIVGILLMHGVDIEQKDSNGHTPLINAVLGNHIDTVSLLLQKGAHLENPDDYGQTAFTHALNEGHTDIIALLLEHGADIEAADRHGKTALMYAALGGHVHTVSLLLQSGADPHKTDNTGHTALSQSIIQGDVAVSELLKQCDVFEEFARDFLQHTPEQPLYGKTCALHACRAPSKLKNFYVEQIKRQGHPAIRAVPLLTDKFIEATTLATALIPLRSAFYKAFAAYIKPHNKDITEAEKRAVMQIKLDEVCSIINIRYAQSQFISLRQLNLCKEWFTIEKLLPS